MFDLFKTKPKLTPEQVLAQRRKEAVFKVVQQLPPGHILSKGDMKEYIQALHGYKSSYFPSRLINFKEFVLMDLKIEKLLIADVFWPNDKNKNERANIKIEDYKRSLVSSGWAPPIIFDAYKGSIIDGNHRAKAARDAGFKIIQAFVGLY